MYLKVIAFLVLISSSLFAEVKISDDEMEIKTANGFETSAKIYGPSETKNNIVFIVLHGKGSAPDKSHYEKMYDDLNDNGYKVIAPLMPWNKKWTGTFTDGMEVVDEIIESNNKNGNKTILLGHSLGGASTLIYSSREKKDGFIGAITIAPGHMIHKSKKMTKITQKSVERARKYVENGDGDAFHKFTVLNTGKVKDVKMTSKIYLSFYDKEIFPNVMDLFDEIKVPVLWIAAKQDRLTKVYRMEDLFEWLPDYDKNSFKLLDGKHKNIVKKSEKSIINWVESL